MINRVIDRYKEFAFSYWLYRTLAFFALIVILFNVGGDTNSYKVFPSLTKGFLGESFIAKYYNVQSFVDANSNATTRIIKDGSAYYLDNKGELIDDLKVSQDAVLPFYPVSFNKKDTTNVASSSGDVSISELISAPSNPEFKSRFFFPKIQVTAPIVYSDAASSVDKLDNSNPCSPASINQPFQQLVRKGLVHQWPSPLPGELFDPKKNVDASDQNRGIGNAYIIGHSSECIAHEYSRIFAPMQDKDLVGENFYIWDKVGRKMSFKVFECKEIESVGPGAAEGYKLFPGERVVTLQTSKYYSNTKINRWICRGRLDIQASVNS
jgi:hypothetical protein